VLSKGIHSALVLFHFELNVSDSFLFTSIEERGECERLSVSDCIYNCLYRCSELAGMFSLECFSGRQISSHCKGVDAVACRMCHAVAWHAIILPYSF